MERKIEKIEWDGAGYYAPDAEGTYRKVDARNVHYSNARNAALDIADGGTVWLATKPSTAKS